MEWLVKILSLRVEDPIDKFLTLVPWIIRRRPQHLEIITHETVESVCNMILKWNGSSCTPYTFRDPKNSWGRRLFFFFLLCGYDHVIQWMRRLNDFDDYLRSVLITVNEWEWWTVVMSSQLDLLNFQHPQTL